MNWFIIWIKAKLLRSIYPSPRTGRRASSSRYIGASRPKRSTSSSSQYHLETCCPTFVGVTFTSNWSDALLVNYKFSKCKCMLGNHVVRLSYSRHCPDLTRATPDRGKSAQKALRCLLCSISNRFIMLFFFWYLVIYLGALQTAFNIGVRWGILSKFQVNIWSLQSRSHQKGTLARIFILIPSKSV